MVMRWFGAEQPLLHASHAAFRNHRASQHAAMYAKRRGHRRTCATSCRNTEGQRGNIYIERVAVVCQRRLQRSRRGTFLRGAGADGMRSVAVLRNEANGRGART